MVTKHLTQNLTTKQHRALSIATIGALIAGFIFLRPFVSLIIISAVAAFSFFPVYAFLQSKLRKEGPAASITLLSAFIIVVIPVLLLGFVTFNQTTSLIRNVNDYIGGRDLSVVGTQLLDGVNATLGSVTNNSVTLELNDIQDYIGKAVSAAGKFLVSFLQSSIGGISSLITSILLFIYLFLAFLTHHRTLIRTFKQLNPLGDEISNVYLRRASLMTKAMVRGQFIIAAAQGITSAVILYIAGIELFALMALVLTILSIIPLGAGIIVIPIGIAQILLGNIWQGVIILVGHFLIISNIDNILRPILVPKEARLNSALTLLAVFAGIAMFGFLGIVIGPVLMILIVTTIEMYNQTNGSSLKTVEKS